MQCVTQSQINLNYKKVMMIVMIRLQEYFMLRLLSKLMKNNSNDNIIEVIRTNIIILTNKKDIEGGEVNNDSLVNVGYEVLEDNNDLSEDRNQAIQTIEASKKNISKRDNLKAEMI